ncbi:DUF6999 family protein [Spirulina sp. 06S082]|uniref:DUF6999 family protein n=1 Tax=Spirulina sp. 06S082 TaxID=3110248 RepID=UPI002B205543|nr:hypothetical protein [Spirulina sp. 06S082]MEA5471914.1 hypothetical protein [Spirulina sp. 06S082]
MNKKDNSLYEFKPYDRRNPDTWDVLYLDNAIPVNLVSKTYMIRDLKSWTRSYLLLPIKVFANLALALILIIKRLLPFQFKFYTFMHRSAAFFLQNFVTPEACYLIVRHICLGSNLINFLIDNGPDRNIEKATLYPKKVSDLAAQTAFLEHDLILYNFVWDYHQAEQKNPNWVEEVKQRGINFESIQDVSVDIDFTRRSWLRILDLESAIELFKVFYSLCLTCDEFERAVLSLQFDENFAMYMSKILESSEWNHIIRNRHPLSPNSTFNAARDLFLHGVMTEYIHRLLEIYKEQN